MMTSIISALKTIIEAITDVQVVYDYEPKTLSSYPAVTITPMGHEDEYLNLRDTRRIYTVIVRVYGELSSTHEETQVKIRDVADEITEKLTNQTNIALGGVVDFTNLTKSTYKFVEGTSSYFVCELEYKATARQNRYTT